MSKVTLTKAVQLKSGVINNPGDVVEVSEEVKKQLENSGCIEGANIAPGTSDNPFKDLSDVIDIKTANKLIDAGITSMDDLANVELNTLQKIKGISKTKAEAIYSSFDEG